MKRLLLILNIALLPFIKSYGSNGTLTLIGRCIVYTVLNEPYQDPGCMANDSLKGNITASVIMSSTVDVTQEGKYFIHYAVPDSISNVTPVTRMVIVGDTSFRLGHMDTTYLRIPVFTHTDSVNQFLQTYEQRYGISLNIITGTVNYNILGFYPVSISLNDTSFDSTCNVICTLLVSIYDGEPPVLKIIGTGMHEFCPGDFFDPLSAIIYYDNYDSTWDITLDINTHSVPMKFDSVAGKYLIMNPPGDYTVYYHAVDKSNNVAPELTILIRINVCTGIEELNGLQTRIYPVPVTDNLYIGPPPEGNTSYQIFSIHGACVATGLLDSSKSIDTRMLDCGIYELMLDNGSVHKFRFVK